MYWFPWNKWDTLVGQGEKKSSSDDIWETWVTNVADSKQRWWGAPPLLLKGDAQVEEAEAHKTQEASSPRIYFPHEWKPWWHLMRNLAWALASHQLCWNREPSFACAHSDFAIAWFPMLDQLGLCWICMVNIMAPILGILLLWILSFNEVTNAGVGGTRQTKKNRQKNSSKGNSLLGDSQGLICPFQLPYKLPSNCLLWVDTVYR